MLHFAKRCISFGNISPQVRQVYSQFTGGSQTRNVGVLVEYGLLPEVEETVSAEDEIIRAVPRQDSGKIIAKKARKLGRCPSIVYEHRDGDKGGHKELISVDTNQVIRILRKYGRSFFLSRVFDLEIQRSSEEIFKQRVLPRQVHLHAGNNKLLNVTFLRVRPEDRIKVDVPVVFLGQDGCIGIRKGGYLNTIRRTVKLECPGNQILPFVEVDLTPLQVGEKVTLSDLKLHPDVSIISQDLTFPICKISGRVSATE